MNAYPLSWPITWPRAKFRQSSAFGGHSLDRVTREVLRQLRLIGAKRVVISTNVKLRNDGLPRGDQPRPADTGSAVYFELKNKPCVLACDKWVRVECNLYAIAKDLDALRGRERWGVGTIEQAFAGYAALPAPGESGAATWYQVLGVPNDAPFEEAKDAYLREAKLCHPDAGGSNESMQRLNTAWDMARKAYGK